MVQAPAMGRLVAYVRFAGSIAPGKPERSRLHGAFTRARRPDGRDWTMPGHYLDRDWTMAGNIQAVQNWSNV